MLKAKANGVEVECEAGTTVFQVAELACEETLRVCYNQLGGGHEAGDRHGGA